MDDGSGQPKMLPGTNGATRVDYGGGSVAVSISNETEPYTVKRPIGVGGMDTVDLAQKNHPKRVWS
jgi:hypothetical protein